MEFKLGNLYVLVDLNNPGKIYPRLFLNEETAQDTADSIGGNWKINHCFINEK